MPRAPTDPGFGMMIFDAGKIRTREADRDDAVDAARFFSRIGYCILAIGAPAAAVLHPLGLFVIFPIGVALILGAAGLEAGPGFLDRIGRTFRIPAFLALLAGLGWAALSILWTPYPIAAAQ